MQALLAIARLTFKAAFRFRLVPLLGLLLIGGVLLLPAVIKDDGSAEGLTQIVLTYTLGLSVLVLGLTTLWLACGTLARDIDECQLQVVAVKPVARWQIWLGKWVGIMLVNLLLLGLAVTAIYVQLQWRAKRLPLAEQAVLQNEVFVARGSFKPPKPDMREDIERLMAERLKNEQVAEMDRGELLKLVTAMVEAQYQLVLSGWVRRWEIDLSSVADEVRDQPLYLRVKFYTANEIDPQDTYRTQWDIGPQQGPYRQRELQSFAAESFHEIKVNPGLLDADGILNVEVANLNEDAILFQFDDGFEVLYREGGFLLNYLRGVSILFFWLALLAAVGLAAASQLSFPVAAFVSIALLVVSFSTGTMRTVVEQGTIREVDHETGLVGDPNLFDAVSVVGFKVMLSVVNVVRDFSPVEQLSGGRSITWGTVARAGGQIVFLMGGAFALVGITLLQRRELATAQNQG
jgi:ABC-type transport system involved in multi-copper enzyme maturation permease subunit